LRLLSKVFPSVQPAENREKSEIRKFLPRKAGVHGITVRWKIPKLGKIMGSG